MTLIEHPHISLFGSTECTCTEEEARALAVVAAYRVAKVSERAPFLAPDFKRHRAGFTHAGELWEHQGPGGMDDDSMRDRQNILLDLTAKNDKVWGIFRVVGTHTGSLYGIPKTGRQIDVIGWPLACRGRAHRRGLVLRRRARPAEGPGAQPAGSDRPAVDPASVYPNSATLATPTRPEYP